MIVIAAFSTLVDRRVCRIILPVISILTISLVARADDAFVKGVDLSVLKAAQDAGVQYKMNGKVTDPLVIFKTNGINYVRLRLFVNPPGTDAQVNTMDYTLALAKRVKRAGLRFYLDFHYSDKWADAGHQIIPRAWKDLSQPELVDKVHDYTLQCLEQFKLAGCQPDMVSVGNEITNGMMWPAGGPLSSDGKWLNLIQLLKAGVRAVRESAPRSRTRIIIHLDKGGSVEVSEWFFHHCQEGNLDFDVIGLSYYPFWHGSLEDLSKNLSARSLKYHKPVLIAETAYNFSGLQGKLPFPCTPEGQKQFLERLMQVVSQTPGGRGMGVCYWEPDWIQDSRWEGPHPSAHWAGRALFDEEGNVLPGLSAFRYQTKAAASSEH